MKYVLAAYRDEAWWKSLSATERAAFEEACRASEQDLVNSHHIIAAWHLQSNATLTLQIVDGKTSLSEDPVVESQKRLVQLFLIQALDLNEAIQIASRAPQAQGGPIEISPLLA